MACLLKDARGRSPYWVCAYTAPDGRRLKRSTKQVNKEKAWQVCLTFIEGEKAVATGSATEQQLRRIIDSALKRIGEAGMGDQTVGQIVETWIGNKSGSLAAASLKAYKQAAELFVTFLGSRAEKSIRQVTKKDVVAFRDWLAKERSPSTANKVKAFVGGAFENAKDEGILDVNVFTLVDSLKTVSTEKDVFSPEQVARLLRVANRDWQGAILLAYGSGARLQDVAKMQWSNVDTENGVLSFTEQKGTKKVLIGLHSDFSDWLSNQPAPDVGGPLFPTLADRPQNGGSGLSNEFKDLMARANITGRQLSAGGKRTWSSLSFHSFRHGAASQVYSNAALEDITRRVTQHSSDSLNRYIHKDLEVLRKAVSLIPRLPKN
jgi:integrase